MADAGNRTAGSGASHAIAARAVAPGAQLWAKQFGGAGDRGAEAAKVAVSPNGQTVYVTGSSWTGKATGMDYTTVAYRAATGARLWVARYRVPGSQDTPTALAVSRDGSTVFVTGYAGVSHERRDFATVAYRAATGAQLWVARYHSPGPNLATALALSPGGTRVFVTGLSQKRPGGPNDYATVAYRAATGTRIWVKRYNGPANSFDVAQAIAVGRSGATVFVTGTSEGRGTRLDYATIAYRAATGTTLWIRRYNGPGNDEDNAHAIVVTGTKVFVTGESDGKTTGPDITTVAYRAATGTRLWVARYNPGEFNIAVAIAISRDGSLLFVTGGTGPQDPPQAFDMTTVAYRAATGTRLWAARYNGPGNSYDQGRAVAVSPDGSKVFVTGESMGKRSGYDYATIAYRTATGARLWLQRYVPGGVPVSLAVSPDGARVFVTGSGNHGGTQTGSNYATVAYHS